MESYKDCKNERRAMIVNLNFLSFFHCRIDQYNSIYMEYFNITKNVTMFVYK